jgi:hypothetical protein
MEPMNPNGAERPVAGEIVPPNARRILERPPSERYLERAEGAAAPTPVGSGRRAGAGAVLVAALGAGLLVLLAAPLALSEPLVAVAVMVGLGIGYGARLGGGTAVQPRRRRVVAVCAALTAVGCAEVVVWQIALSEGGVLSFVDYQLQAFGPVAILQPVAAGLAALAAA